MAARLTPQVKAVRAPCKKCGKPVKRAKALHCSRECAGNTKHGLCYSLEHRSWRNMIDRCTNPRCKYWPDYGGRGITVCERWREFNNFYADMGPKPTDRKRYSIERIDNNKGYEPGNCKWATPKEQARNRRTCWTPEEDAALRQAIADGLNFAQAAKILGKSVHMRAYRLGLKSNYDPNAPRKAAA